MWYTLVHFGTFGTLWFTITLLYKSAMNQKTAVNHFFLCYS